MRVLISEPVLAKIGVLNISLIELEEAINNLETRPIIDKKYQTKPPTYWFVSETFDTRVLFVACIWDEVNEKIIIKTARDADDNDIERWFNGKW